MKQGGVEQIDHLLRAGRIAEALDAPLLEQAAGASRDRLRNLFKPKRHTGAADAVGTSALTFGDLLYDAVAVNPTVIEATDFSSADSVENIFVRLQGQGCA